MNQISKKVSIALFTVILICFMIPFVTVSCGAQNIATISGAQLITGTEIEGQQLEPQIMVIIAFLCAAGGLIVSFSKPSGIGVMFGGAGAILLFLFKQGLIKKAQEQMVGVQFETGYWLAFILFIIAAGVSAYNALSGANENGSSKPVQTIMAANTAQQPQNESKKFCEKCGAKLEKDEAFCSKCGAKQS